MAMDPGRWLDTARGRVSGHASRHPSPTRSGQHSTPSSASTAGSATRRPIGMMDMMMDMGTLRTACSAT